MSNQARSSRARRVPEAEWAKSRWSDPGGECVELAVLPDAIVAIRNSRYPDGLWLLFPREDVLAFIRATKAGDFDHIVQDITNPARRCLDAGRRVPPPESRKEPQGP